MKQSAEEKKRKKLAGFSQYLRRIFLDHQTAVFTILHERFCSEEN
jgi:hypothetical protein